MSDDDIAPSFRLPRVNQQPLNGVYVKRICRNCPADITHLHGNSTMCIACATKYRLEKARISEAKRRPITGAVVMLYMELYAPKALKDIKDRIRAIRRAGNSHLLKRTK